MTSTEQNRRKYDAIADRYEDIFRYVADVGHLLVADADPAKGARVLDIGAGRGAVARAALARGCAVTAVDASAGMVDRLSADYPEITAREMDAAELDFADGAFDLVTAGFVVQVLEHPAQVLAEIRRVLAPGGTVALSLERATVGRSQWLHDLNAEFFSPPSTEKPAQEPAEPSPDRPGPLTAPRLDELLSAAGFVGLTTNPVDLPVPMADPADLWDWLVLQGIPDALRALPGNRGEEFRDRLFASAEEQQANGGIVIDFAATLHVAHSPD